MPTFHGAPISLASKPAGLRAKYVALNGGHKLAEEVFFTSPVSGKQTMIERFTKKKLRPGVSEQKMLATAINDADRLCLAEGLPPMSFTVVHYDVVSDIFWDNLQNCERLEGETFEGSIKRIGEEAIRRYGLLKVDVYNNLERTPPTDNVVVEVVQSPTPRYYDVRATVDGVVVHDSVSSEEGY